MNKIYKIFLVLVLALPLISSGQEYIKAPSGNLNLFYNKPIQKKNTSELKITAISDTIPFFEDFYYAPTSPYPTGNHWTDSTVFINSGFAISPPSIGVATFDGLNKKGYPYNIAATTIVSAAADTLTSKPINMFTKGSYTYSPADSMGFSFWYQAKGFGENPAVNDSLILEFYKPLYPVTSGTNTTYGKWFSAWGKRGNNSPPANDTLFKRAFVRIADTAYFHDGFRFRFRNKATPSGSVDHWHVDYIEIKPYYTKTDSIIEDVSFTYVPRPMLKNYSSMPWYQYEDSEMGTNFSNFLKYTGTFTPGVNCSYNFNTYSSTGILLNSENKGANNIKPFMPTPTYTGGGYQNYGQHAYPPINYTFTALSDSTSFIIKHYISATAAANNKTLGNDTVYQRLEFNNFYAYDDGSAESVYYHNTYGAKDAIKFKLNKIDTLRALDIFFDPFTDGNIIKNSQFRMYVWSDDGIGGQPGTVIRKDSAMKPIYLDHGYNKIPRYFFTSPMILNAGTYYIGMQQITNQPLYVGFDRNLNRSSKLYYDVGSGWTQSAIPGSLMIHPVMGEANRALVGIKEQTVKSKEGFIKVYPNPANDKLFISAEELNSRDNYTLELYSVIGTKLSETKVENTTTEINLNEYANGIYFVVLKQNNSTITNKKFIISR